MTLPIIKWIRVSKWDIPVSLSSIVVTLLFILVKWPYNQGSLTESNLLRISHSTRLNEKVSLHDEEQVWEYWN